MRTQLKRTAILLMVMMLSIGYTNAQFWFWNKAEDGNGDVTRVYREVEDFKAISAATGLKVYIKQGNKNSVQVETDSNLQDHVLVEEDDGWLKLHIDGNINNPTKLNVYVTYQKLKGIKASSSARIENRDVIHSEAFDIDISSGSRVYLNVNTMHLTCETSSGASARLRGKTNYLQARSSSGSQLKASKLEAERCKARASSGASINIFVKESLEAHASSGAQIDYRGNPKEVERHTSSGGGISRD